MYEVSPNTRNASRTNLGKRSRRELSSDAKKSNDWTVKSRRLLQRQADETANVNAPVHEYRYQQDVESETCKPRRTCQQYHSGGKETVDISEVRRLKFELTAEVGSFGN